MREVLFRGKRADYGEWIEGYYAKQSNHACFAHELKYQHFIFKDVCLDFNLGGLQEFEIIPETVGQYTGLTDKNGKRIFEGDIVECVSGGEQAVISWLKYSACFGLSFDGWCCGFDDYDFSPNDFKVIGNIHDNPEIIKSANP